MPNAHTATAADFDAAAQRHANAFWFWAIAAVAIGYFLGWWAVIPSLFAVWCITSSVSSTRMGQRLRDGTYPLPNSNNGAPDGDARNYGSPTKAYKESLLNKNQ